MISGKPLPAGYDTDRVRSQYDASIVGTDTVRPQVLRVGLPACGMVA